MTIEIQFVSLFSMLFTGIYLGCMFDTNERIGKFFQAKKILSFFFQFIFWLLQSLLIFLFLIKVNGGYVRFYLILAIILGYWIYFHSFRDAFRLILDKLIIVLSKIFLAISRLFTVFIIKPIVFAIQTFLSLVNLAIMVIFRIVSYLLKLIEWTLRPILNMIPENVRKYLVSFSKIYSKIVDRLRCVK